MSDSLQHLPTWELSENFLSTPWHEFPASSTLSALVRGELAVVREALFHPGLSRYPYPGAPSRQRMTIEAWRRHPALGLCALNLLWQPQGQTVSKHFSVTTSYLTIFFPPSVWSL